MSQITDGSNDTFSLRNLQGGLSDVFAHHLYDRLSPKDLWSLYATDTRFRDDLNTEIHAVFEGLQSSYDMNVKDTWSA